MFKILAELLMTGEVKFEEGEISVLHSRFMLVPADFLAVLTAEFSQDKTKAKFFYELTKKIARDNFLSEIRKKYGVTQKKLMLDLGKSLAELAGYGRFEPLDYDEKNKRAIVHAYNTPIGTALKGRANRPVDHILRGIIAAIAEVAYDLKAECIETKCIALGDPYCEFIVRRRLDFEAEHSQLIEDQLSLDDAEKR